ncbi:hypothetical protein SERLADRAFT_349762 [Serpula lacrymans var. lacrymans S7.9]|uniref:GAG-pre-integrase domain-containing protein n=1 Tax=Serpula lacrymans var. lacrymans (strain S7.9) TaxID=578457 RepID=F8NZK5_SERL9|nr:uncharacterized protein SERLADRAFT_349762 [Serpula lacrymans var. lacrymans S7.9]EGO24025.1 hypothetical protein SERLADRAFT_349762 [Serpula lacrymans var. lacrymans S7.9]
MGHIAHKSLKHLVDSNLAEGIVLDSSEAISFCETCVQAKAIRKPFPKTSHTRAKHYAERIHSDLWGPAIVQDLKGKRYMLTFTDDFS